MTATAHTPAASDRSPSVDPEELPLWRLHAMRVGYAFMGVGLAVAKWPIVIGYDQSFPPFEGVVAVALPAAVAGEVNQAMSQIIFNCSFDVVILAVTPWGYVWRHYVVAKGDRWR